MVAGNTRGTRRATEANSRERCKKSLHLANEYMYQISSVEGSLRRGEDG